MLNIDEAIAHARKNYNDIINTTYNKCQDEHLSCEGCATPTCKEIADENLQIAEWLEELKVIKYNCDGKCTSCINTELPNIKDCKEIDIGYSYAYKTDCAGDRYIKAEEVKYLLECERGKAIDDFAILMKEALNHDWSTTKIYEQIIYNRLFDKCNEIAEQLKVGETSGTDNQ